MTDRIEKSIEIRAPIERVWTALTDHEQFGTWFKARMAGPFKVGEVIRGQVTSPGYEHITWEAKVTAMERPHRFAFTWHPFAIDPQVDYSAEPPTLVEFALEAAGQGTRLTVAESGFDALPAHRRDMALRMNEGGWTEQLLNIKTYADA